MKDGRTHPMAMGTVSLGGVSLLDQAAFLMLNLLWPGPLSRGMPGAFGILTQGGGSTTK